MRVISNELEPLGRVEHGLILELADKPTIGHAERASLRVMARAIDYAEAAVDWEAITRASRVYLELRTAAGLTALATRGRGRPSVEAEWDRWLIELAEPTGGNAEDA